MLYVALFIFVFFTSLLTSSCGEKTAEPAPTVVSKGESIFNKNCKVCHAQGINGAPILGNKAMWEPRLKQGTQVLVEHAISGFGLMPAKGGKTSLPDEDVSLAVNYMVSKVQ